MVMKQIYKVIFIDDEVDVLCDDEKISRCLIEGVEIIKAHNIGELEESLRNFDGYVDAIVTGVNFSSGDDGIAADGNDSSGFNRVQQIVEVYRSKGRYIPYYICSGKPELVKERYLKYNELEELETNGRIFSNDEFWTLIEKVKSDVVRIQSPEFRIRNQYSSELKAVKNCLSSAHEILLMEILIYCEEGRHDFHDTIGYFNPLRKLIEVIRDKCEDLGIIPTSISSLNDFRRFMQGMEVSGYSINKGEVMPPTLARSLYYYLDITQDASHSKDDLKLNVEQFVQSQKNVLLLKAIVNIALDICLWFNKYTIDNPDFAANESRWAKDHKEDPNKELYRGKAVTAYSMPDNKPMTVCGRYSLSKEYLGQEVIIYGPCAEPRYKECYCDSKSLTIIGHATNVKVVNHPIQSESE